MSCAEASFPENLYWIFPVPLEIRLGDLSRENCLSSSGDDVTILSLWKNERLVSIPDVVSISVPLRISPKNDWRIIFGRMFRLIESVGWDNTSTGSRKRDNRTDVENRRR